jgi:hypothetical protein
MRTPRRQVVVAKEVANGPGMVVDVERDLVYSFTREVRELALEQRPAGERRENLRHDVGYRR